MAARLVEVRPETKVVFMSGHTEYAKTQQEQTSPNATLLPKPLTRHTLARAVREVLHGRKIQ